MEIQFQSHWLERCMRDYLGIEDRPITEDDVRVIKYLSVSTTHNYQLGFSKEVLPKNFAFSDAGDEWFFCCLSDTAKYCNIEDFIDIQNWSGIHFISIKSELLGQEKSNDPKEVVAQTMQDFESSVKIYGTEKHDFEGLVRNDKTYDYGLLVPEDFSHFTNLEVVRLMGCETEIHSLAFLKMLPKLRVLEVGEVRLNTLDGLEKLKGLEKLCIWSN